MKTYLWVAAVVVLGVMQAFGDTDSFRDRLRQDQKLSADDWHSVITRDSKLSSLQNFIGVKPNRMDLNRQGMLVSQWYGLLDDGNKIPAALVVKSVYYQGSDVIVSLVNPHEVREEIFPWTSAVVRTALGNKIAAKEGL